MCMRALKKARQKKVEENVKCIARLGKREEKKNRKREIFFLFLFFFSTDLDMSCGVK